MTSSSEYLILAVYPVLPNNEPFHLWIHVGSSYSSPIYDLIYDLLSRPQSSSGWADTSHGLRGLSDLHLRLGRFRVCHNALSNSLNLGGRSGSFSRPSNPAPSSPAEELLDQAYQNRYSDWAKEGHVDSEFVLIGLINQLSSSEGRWCLRNIASPSSKDQRMLCSPIQRHP